MHHESHSKAAVIKNQYEPRSGFRTFTGVVSSILFMGVPVGLTEFLRPGGDTLTWQISFAATAVAIILAVLSLPMALLMLTKGLMGITLVMSAVVGIVTGVTILGISKALHDVVDTKGNDVALLMAALQKLSTAYTIQLVASGIGFVIGFIGGAAGMKF